MLRRTRTRMIMTRKTKERTSGKPTALKKLKKKKRASEWKRMRRKRERAYGPLAASCSQVPKFELNHHLLSV